MPGNPAADIIGGGIGGVFNYLGAKKQANAIEDASKLQDKFSNRALDYTIGEKNALTERLRPYVEGGTTASQTAAKLLAASPYVTARPPVAAPMITLRAPDGSTKQFASGDPMVALAQQKGATVVDAPQMGGYAPAAMAARI